MYLSFLIVIRKDMYHFIKISGDKTMFANKTRFNKHVDSLLKTKPKPTKTIRKTIRFIILKLNLHHKKLTWSFIKHF